MEDSGFVGATLEATGSDDFDAGRYSFFGTLTGEDDSLEGALEDGLEAPPEEELLDEEASVEPDFEDLSFATMFTASAPEKDKGGLQENGDDDGHAIPKSNGLDANQIEPLPQVSRPKLGSIALGGLLTSTTPSALEPTSRLSSTSQPSIALASPHHQPSSLLPSPGAPYLHNHPQPIHFAANTKPLTPAELEAQLRASSGLPNVGPNLAMNSSPLPGFPGMSPGGGPAVLPPPQLLSAVASLPHRPENAQSSGVFTPEIILKMQQQQQQQQQRPPYPLPYAGPNTFPSPKAFPSKTGLPVTQATLAQRLRALNLVDKQELVRMPVRRQRASRCMKQDEIESILHMQWRPLHQGPPYIEDYYYQAFVYKHYGKRNMKSFAPEAVRELAPTEKLAPDEVAFVKLDGLGRVPFSNVRRPRPLMDLAQGDPTSQKGINTTGHGEAGVRRLDQEPMLAARIMIEDCMALILDVQDIDRIFSAAAASGEAIENEQLLVQRRLLLIDGLSASLRLADTPQVSSSQTSDPSSVTYKATGASDGVFLRLLSIPKGLVLAAHALEQIYPPPELSQAKQPIRPNLRILWAILRHVGKLFGGKDQPRLSGGSVKGSTIPERKDIELATSRVAAATAAVLRRLHERKAVCDAIMSLTHGDLATFAAEKNQLGLLPLHLIPRHHGSDVSAIPWLVDILTALLQRAAELELLPDQEAMTTGGEYSVWRRDFGALYDFIYNHMRALQQAAVQARDAQGDGTRYEEIRKGVPLDLVRVLLQHCTQDQAVEIKTILASVGV